MILVLKGNAELALEWLRIAQGFKRTKKVFAHIGQNNKRSSKWLVVTVESRAITHSRIFKLKYGNQICKAILGQLTLKSVLFPYKLCHHIL